MKINLTQTIKDIDDSDRNLDPEYRSDLLLTNVLQEVEKLFGKEKAELLIESLTKKQLVPEKATLKNVLLMGLKVPKAEGMDQAIKDYKMLERVKAAETEIDLGQEEAERLLEKVHSLFKDVLVTGQVKELLVDVFEPAEPAPEPEPEKAKE